MTVRAPPEMPEEYELLLRRKVKAELRERMRGLRRAVPAEMRALRSTTIAERVRALPEWSAARCVAAFAAIRSEVDVAVLVAAARGEGKAVVLPRVGEDDALHFHVYEDGDALPKSAFGVPEPEPHAPSAQPDLVLVPGLAFDERGHRVGYGAGYYDRYLAATPGVLTVGVAFDFQLAPDLPETPGDVPLRIVVTDARVVRVPQ